MHGTDLADLYRDRLTLRQVWVRLKALPRDAPLLRALEAAQVEDEETQQVQDIDDVLAQFQPKGG